MLWFKKKDKEKLEQAVAAISATGSETLIRVEDIKERITNIENASKNIESTITKVATTAAKPDTGRVMISGNELLASREAYERDMRAKVKIEYMQYREDIEKCFDLYDKLLYRAGSTLANGDYVTLVKLITQLDVLRSFILENMLGTSNIFSFYLYLVDTPALRKTLERIPAIDTEKVFLITPDKSGKRDEDHYMELVMTDSYINVATSTSDINFPLSSRNTVLRVLYSIYTEKYYLYHLWE